MATIRKRKGKWQVQIRHHGHNGVSKTYLRKQEADQWARELSELFWVMGLLLNIVGIAFIIPLSIYLLLS